MDIETNEDDYDPRIQQAMDFLNWCQEAESTNRSEAAEDLKFAAGDQWPVEIQNSRNLEARPCLTINKMDAYVRQITNQQRQQRPRMKAHGMNDQSDEKIAEIITGICRHIELNSNADSAYDTAFDFAVRMGWGYIRLRTDYAHEDSFDQEIFIDAVHNPFTVYFDPNSTMPDGSDAEFCLITEVISKKVFRKMYPDAEETSFTLRGTGDSNAEWVTREDIRIAEYYYTKRTESTLYLLSDGTKVWKDEYKERDGVMILDERKSLKKTIHWCKLTAMEILEERDIPGRYIPVIPVFGQQLNVEGKRKRFGLVRQAKDPQRMYNFWQTAITESIALAPKAKWILAEGQDEGHEEEWAQANVKAFPVLRYKQKDIDGTPAPPPQRLQPEPPPAGVMAAAATIQQDLQSVVGIYDPSQLPTGNISGKALQGQQMQVDMVNYNYYDNLTRSIRQVGKIVLQWIPKIYDTQRVMRIIGDDGKHELVTLNQRVQDTQGVSKVLNDVTIGEYDVVMETGPGYNSKRQEAVDAMLPLLSANQELFNVAGDLVFRNMDFPGAETIADRLAAANPLAQINTKSDIPPQVQMQLAQSQQQLQVLQQQLEEMQLAMQQRQDIEQVKQDAETKRELMRQTAKAHNTMVNAETKAHDVATRAITAQNVEEIKAVAAMLMKHMDTTELEAEIQKRNTEQYQHEAQTYQAINPTGGQ